MNDNLSRFGFTLLIIICVVLSVIYVKGLADKKEMRIIRAPAPNYIPSAIEIQQRLKDLNESRYDPGKVDGIIGRQSQTAWDNYVCDRYAKECFENQ